jgi:transcriptional regulator PpsR
MSMDTESLGSSSFQSPQDNLGDLKAHVAAQIVAAASDVAMIIDREGIIRDLAVSSGDMASDGISDIRDRRWIDTVAPDSRDKVAAMLRDVSAGPASRWREINQQFPRGGSVPVRFIALNAGSPDKIIAVGRDLRVAVALQQRLLQAQQAMERDYVKLRQAESRYRLLFQTSNEAVLILDALSRKIMEANPAAGLLLGVNYQTLVGAPFPRIIHADSQDLVASLLMSANGTQRADAVDVRLANDRGLCGLSVSLFRQDGLVHLLIRLTPPAAATGPDADVRQRLLRVLDRIPDAFVVVDNSMSILAANMAFAELAHLVNPDAARGLPLANFLGRSSVDLTVLHANLREHGWVRNFSTIVRSQFDGQEAVDVSAVSVPDADQPYYGISLRPLGRRVMDGGRDLRELPRSAEQMTDLIGRVSLKEIVRETTDIIERLCIEAALELTGNNRASAAEMLGLSRQSLYSKLHRHGLANPETDPLGLE